jgi:hypothetical protein
MGQSRNTGKPSGGRGSKEAIEKRRAARQLNSLLMGGKKPGDKPDGRTEKRRQRLIAELKEGRRGIPLKPIDFVSHVNELLDLGETVASIKRHGVRPRRTELTPDIVKVVRHTQTAYGFHPEAWQMLGVPVKEALRAAASPVPDKRRSVRPGRAR